MTEKRGRPATGRTTKTVRVPMDMDMDKAISLYYGWLPILEFYAKEPMNTPRHWYLAKLMDNLQAVHPLGGGGKTHPDS